MKVLVLNSGSSSVKYRLFGRDGGAALASGVIERIGESARGHAGAVERIARELQECGAIAGAPDLFGVGHRVVHGGERFSAPTLIDERVEQGIEAMVPHAPLHNPANLAGIRILRRLWPQVPQVAVFDTAFHQTLPPHAYLYALPIELYERHGVRRYGFHGTSHAFVARRAAEFLGRPAAALNLVTLHLGNGASAAAIQGGRCVDTSMGLTPLEGLVMGSRSGDVDPAILFHLGRTAGLTLDQLEDLLTRRSGLRGLCGENDLRAVRRLADGGDRAACRALDLYVYRIRKYIGAYAAVLGRLDAVVFTAGVGENDAGIRERVCRGLAGLGIEIDPIRNGAPSREAREIGPAAARVRVLVIPTDEEREIADQTVACIRAARAAAGSRATRATARSKEP